MSDSDDPARKAAYEAWAKRLRARTKTDADEAATDNTASTSGYWSTESLYRDSQLDRERQREQDRRRAHINQLLATLGLPPGSSLKDCSDRVRQLAREVHPDMNMDKSTRTGKVQLERMVEINKAYEELKRALA